MAITQLHSQRIQDAPQSADLARQAIINSNFEIWQLATSFTPSSGDITSDRWLALYDADGGTLPTDTISRQNLTAGDIDKSYRFYRLNVDGAGSGFGNDAYYQVIQRVEGGTRFLAGAGKTVTVSFWAKSDIVGKELGISLIQNYGTGGSPSSAETITGDSWTLTSSWTQYSYTFTLNTLSGKTLGTSINDYLELKFWYMWGSNNAATVGAGGAEDFGGSGNIDIAQVQMCSGTEILPYEPKGYDTDQEECLRYLYAMRGQGGIYYESAFARSTTNTVAIISYPKILRTNPTFTANGIGTDYNVIYKTSSTNPTAAPTNLGSTRFSSYVSFTTSAVLTAGEGTQLLAATTGAGLIWNAEL